ncbi:Z-ring formation inhibitor MciZ [Paenibacillus chitinolyticus]|nr:Z-ring formation inhibitor MciZ [Paenibacillus chitinolyticus]MEC0245669.1 Z-ring formation inhibitor MciZ [Paenibacillus chitinolyticus]
MKNYTASESLRLVGKAWEIKQYLQLAVQKGGRDLPLVVFLGQKSG